MTIRSITDLNAPCAPQSDCTDADAEDYLYVYRNHDLLEAVRMWAEGAAFDPASLLVRSASHHGVWATEIEHECLPDFSCCFPTLRAPVEERIAYYEAFVSYLAENTLLPFDCKLVDVFFMRLLEHEGLEDEVFIAEGAGNNMH